MAVDAHAHVGPWKLAGLEGLSCTLDEAVGAALVESLDGLLVTRSDGGDNEALRKAVGEETRIDLWFAPWIKPGTKDARDLATVVHRLQGVGQLADLVRGCGDGLIERIALGLRILR